VTRHVASPGNQRTDQGHAQCAITPHLGDGLCVVRPGRVTHYGEGLIADQAVGKREEDVEDVVGALYGRRRGRATHAGEVGVDAPEAAEVGERRLQGREQLAMVDPAPVEGEHRDAVTVLDVVHRRACELALHPANLGPRAARSMSDHRPARRTAGTDQQRGSELPFDRAGRATPSESVRQASNERRRERQACCDRPTRSGLVRRGRLRPWTAGPRTGRRRAGARLLPGDVRRVEDERSRHRSLRGESGGHVATTLARGWHS
jgi:hypothetical protein